MNNREYRFIKTTGELKLMTFPQTAMEIIAENPDLCNSPFHKWPNKAGFLLIPIEKQIYSKDH